MAPAVFALSMMASASSGCATVLRGPNTDFHIVTEPPGAFVQTDLTIPASKRSNEDVYSCEATPCSFEVSRRSNFTVFVELDGYHPASVEVTSGFGKSGGRASATGAVTGATGAYVVSYSLISGVASAMGAIASIGASSSAATAGAGSAAATGAAGIGVLFLGVDLASGAMLDVRPNPLVLILIPDDHPLPEPGNEVIETEETLERIRTSAAPSDLSIEVE